MQQKCEELSANLRKETEASDVLEQSLAKAQAGSIDPSLSRDSSRSVHSEGTCASTGRPGPSSGVLAVYCNVSV